MHLTSHIIDPMAMPRYIAHYRSNVFDQRFSETLVLNETKPTKRSQITDQNLRKEANAKCAVSVDAKRVSNS